MTSSRVAAGVLLLGAWAALARAETRPEEDVTPLALLRHADAVALVRAEGGEALKVEETIRGVPRAGESLPLAPRREDADLVLQPGVRSLAFLRRVAGGKWEVFGGGLGLFAVPEPAPGTEDAPVLALTRALAAETTPAGIRAALVAAVTSPDRRMAAGAALDLLREPGLLEGATEAERAALVDAFRAASNRSRARVHLARAVGRMRPDGAGRLLADAVLAADGGLLREAAGLAIGEMKDEAAVAYLASRTADASPAVRAAIAGTLGACGLAAARAPLESLLGAAEPEVRLEATLGLGRLRSAAAAPALLARFRSVEPEVRVRRAVAWALVQCDAPEAWGALDEAAGSEKEEATFRAFLRETMANPRRGFVR